MVPHQRANRGTAQAGMALPAALWVSLVVTLIVSAVLNLTMGQKQLVSAREAQIQMEFAAEAAILATVKTLADSRGHFTPSPAPHEMRFGDYRVEVLVSNEAGKVNVNLAKSDLITSLFEEAGLSPSFAASAVEEIIERREAGKPFRTMPELAGLLTPDFLNCLRDDITLYFKSPLPKERFASRRLRKVLADMVETVGPGSATSVIRPEELARENIWRVRALIPLGEKSSFEIEAIIEPKADLERPFAAYAWEKRYAWQDEGQTMC